MKGQQAIMVFLKASLLCFLMIFTANVYAEATTVVDDSIITTKIKSKIMLEKPLSVLDIGVSTHNGVVTLTGNVDSTADIAKAIEIAQSTEGVKDVDAAKLTLTKGDAANNKALSDTLITAKVKGLFIQEKLFGEGMPINIHVETKNGIVHLSGTVDNKKQADRAITLAKSVKGVKNVISTVKVETLKASS